MGAGGVESPGDIIRRTTRHQPVARNDRVVQRGRALNAATPVGGLVIVNCRVGECDGGGRVEDSAPHVRGVAGDR